MFEHKFGAWVGGRGDGRIKNCDFSCNGPSSTAADSSTLGRSGGGAMVGRRRVHTSVTTFLQSPGGRRASLAYKRNVCERIFRPQLLLARCHYSASHSPQFAAVAGRNCLRTSVAARSACLGAIESDDNCGDLSAGDHSQSIVHCRRRRREREEGGRKERN